MSFCIQEAGFPPGVILEIRMYLDKGKRVNNIFRVNFSAQLQKRNTGDWPKSLVVFLFLSFSKIHKEFLKSTCCLDLPSSMGEHRHFHIKN